ncbi:MAG: hypothetical protein EZS28_029966, partial [Streblomastix strix]
FINSFYTSDFEPIISFSHFVPRRELLPPQIFLKHKFLPYVVGSITLEQQVRSLGSTVHCYGHTHINQERVIDGIRYVQNALGYPREREYYGSDPKLVQVWPIFETQCQI